MEIYYEGVDRPPVIINFPTPEHFTYHVFTWMYVSEYGILTPGWRETYVDLEWGY